MGRMWVCLYTQEYWRRIQLNRASVTRFLEGAYHAFHVRPRFGPPRICENLPRIQLTSEVRVSPINTALPPPDIPLISPDQVEEFISRLRESVRRRVENIPPPAAGYGSSSGLAHTLTFSAGRVAVLFSGGVDSTLLAVMLHQYGVPSTVANFSKDDGSGVFHPTNQSTLSTSLSNAIPPSPHPAHPPHQNHGKHLALKANQTVPPYPTVSQSRTTRGWAPRTTNIVCPTGWAGWRRWMR
jgi:hypothetical protein